MTQDRTIERHGYTHDRGAEDELLGVIPVGGIVLFWTNAGKRGIPTGWAICNGNNGTPNLVGAFPRGAASGAVEGATGGAASASLSHDHNHDNASAMSHTNNHSGTAAGLTNNHGGHVHGPGGTIGVTAGADGIAWLNGNSGNGADPAHGIAITAQPNAHGDHAAHGHAAHSNHSVATLPPYLDVVYIMRIR